MRNQQSKSFLLLTVIFAVFSVAGALAATAVSEAPLPYPAVMPPQTFAAKLTNIGLYPLLSVLFGTSVFGVAVIPVIVSVKGFILTFALTALMQSLGSGNQLQFLLTQFPLVIVTVPVLLILSAQAISSSAKLLRLSVRTSVSGSVFTGRYWLTVLVCGLLAVVAALIHL